MVSRVRNAHFYTNCQQSTSGQQSCCILVPGKASGICKEVLNLFASISARSGCAFACRHFSLSASCFRLWPNARFAVGRYLCKNHFDARVTLELVEGSPEFFLLLEEHRELDAQLGGLGLYLGEAQGEFSLAGGGFGVAPFGAVALADVLQTFCGVAAHAFAVGFELLALHVLSDAFHPSIREQLRDDLRRCLLEKPVGHGLPPLAPIVTSAGAGGRSPTLALRGPLHVPENDTSAGARAFEGRKIQT